MKAAAEHRFFTSLTRISDLRERGFEVGPRERTKWGNGDYVVGRVLNRSPIPIELASGRLTNVVEGDAVVGALGRRAATLEAVGSFEDVADDGVLEALTGAGLLGRATSVSAILPELIRLRYLGHACLDGRAARMSDYRPGPAAPFDGPVVLIVGTSMSAGKTTAAQVIIRLLNERGLRVVGAKLTGAGRYRDILSMKDAGAVEIFDFVDAGLPSTVCPEEEFVEATEALLGCLGAVDTDVVVAEAGASPLEPYNGAAALRLLGDRVRCLVLCAADPYAVIGVMQAFERSPDVVCGLATSTAAGIELVKALSGLPALDVLDLGSRGELRAILEQTLDDPRRAATA